MPKKCETCLWYDDADFYNDPKYPEDALGNCNWPASRLPVSLEFANRERRAVRPDEGADCPCYEGDYQ